MRGRRQAVLASPRGGASGAQSCPVRADRRGWGWVGAADASLRAGHRTRKVLVRGPCTRHRAGRTRNDGGRPTPRRDGAPAFGPEADQLKITLWPVEKFDVVLGFRSRYQVWKYQV